MACATTPPSLGFLLNDISRLMSKRFEFRARDTGLTRAQWHALAYLKRNEGIHNAGLAELLAVEPISLTRVLDKLVERGLVERRAHPTDRRLKLMYLTDEARGLFSGMQGLAEETRAEAIEGFSAEERELLLSMLERVKTNMSRACQAQGLEEATP